MNMTHPDILDAERYGVPIDREIDEQKQREMEELRDELRKSKD